MQTYAALIPAQENQKKEIPEGSKGRKSFGRLKDLLSVSVAEIGRPHPKKHTGGLQDQPLKGKIGPRRESRGSKQNSRSLSRISKLKTKKATWAV